MSETCPFCSAKAAFSNSDTMAPLEKNPKSPPLFFETSEEYSLARFAKLSPFEILVLRSCATLSFSTKICAQ